MYASTSQLTPLHHVAIQVRDVRRALDWYRHRFHTELIYEDPTWAMLRFHNIYLALVVPGQHPPHIAFVHPQAEHFGPLTRHRDGSESIYIEDSEGNAIEIMKED